MFCLTSILNVGANHTGKIADLPRIATCQKEISNEVDSQILGRIPLWLAKKGAMTEDEVSMCVYGFVQLSRRAVQVALS